VNASPEPGGSTGRGRTARLLGLAAVIALFAMQVSADWSTTPDSVRYLSIARRIAARSGITDLGNPAPSFPPGYPLLISPAFLVSDRPFRAIGVIHLALVAVLAWATYAWARRRTRDGAALVTAFVLVNASLWLHFRRPLSELAFMTIALALVELLHRLVQGEPGGLGRAGRIVACSALMFFLPLVREVGVVFPLAFAALSLIAAWRGRLPATMPLPLVMALSLAGVGALGLFTLYDFWASHRAEPASATHLASMLEPPVPHAAWAANALRYRIDEIGRLVVPGTLRDRAAAGWLQPRVAVYLTVTILVVLGWSSLVRRGDLLAAAAAPYVAIYLAWGFESGTRYMLPLLPLIAGSLWLALERVPRARVALFSTLIAIHLAASVVDWRTRDLPRTRECAATWPVVESLARFLPPAASLSASAEVPECVQSMLGFLRDRVTEPLDNPWPRPGSSAFRVEPVSAPVPAGAAPVAEVAPYRLLRRGDPP